jgi:hypothetical protein
MKFNLPELILIVCVAIALTIGITSVVSVLVSHEARLRVIESRYIISK